MVDNLYPPDSLLSDARKQRIDLQQAIWIIKKKSDQQKKRRSDSSSFVVLFLFVLEVAIIKMCSG